MAVKNTWIPIFAMRKEGLLSSRLQSEKTIEQPAKSDKFRRRGSAEQLDILNKKSQAKPEMEGKQ